MAAVPAPLLTERTAGVPSYIAEGDVPQKCSLLGTYEQMGPAPLGESRAFWEAFVAHVRLRGTHTR